MAPPTLEERRYAIEALTVDFTRDIRDATVLVKAVPDRAVPLDKLINRYDHARKRLRFMEASVAHHRYWQPAIRDYATFFAKQNEVVELAKALRAAEEPAEAEKVRGQILERIAPFTEAPGLIIEGGVLRLDVVTDIEDEEFRTEVIDSVQLVWNESAAAKQAGLRIELTLEVIEPTTLYGGQPPLPGSTIDERAHLGRFPAGRLVLTTGGDRTHAIVGRYVQLGTDPVTPRQLAHEVGHLLGFADAYLRGYEEAGPYGVVIVEWSGLQDDLMGAPSSGPVTDRMVERLQSAYTPRR